jgi:hypothetical protein
MTNRFGRIIDRSRQLSEVLKKTSTPDRAPVLAQVQILSRRAHLVRSGIIFAIISLLLAAILVIALFVTALMNLNAVIISITLFTGCLVSLIVALIQFLRDVNLSLVALKLEIGSLD